MYTILIVEDNENQRYLYRQELEGCGYRVLEAPSGQEAIDIVSTVQVSLVILDICMPGMDGIETLGRLLANDRQLPVILHTAYSNYQDNFMSWSADRYVVKSSDLSDLKASIADLLVAPKEADGEKPKPASNEVNV